MTKYIDSRPYCFKCGHHLKNSQFSNIRRHFETKHPDEFELLKEKSHVFRLSRWDFFHQRTKEQSSRLTLTLYTSERVTMTESPNFPYAPQVIKIFHLILNKFIKKEKAFQR